MKSSKSLYHSMFPSGINLTLRQKSFRLAVFLLTGLSACIKPYTPPVQEFDELLVVEGRLSNDTTGSEIRLSRTHSLTSDSAMPLAGAAVFFEAENGASHELLEAETGLYRSNPDRFMPVTGEAYRLRVIIPGGTTFLSTFESLKPVPPVTDLKAVYTEIIPDNPEDSIGQGLEFQVNTYDPTGNTRYYAWTWAETYDFFLSYPIYERFKFEPVPQSYSIRGVENTRHCWRFGSSRRIHVATSRQLEEDRIVDHPLAFLPANSQKAYWTYSLLVKQFALSEAEFTYLQTVKENTETTGSLFDPIPAELRGNIRQVDDSSQQVIGYFGASEVAYERKFVGQDDFPEEVLVTYPFRGCLPFNIEADLDLLREYLEGGDYLWVDSIYALDPSDPPVSFYIIQAECGDCKLTGSPERPPYWP